jgi:hypothetical protein
MTQMPNQPLVSKTFVSSHACSCPFQKLNDVDKFVNPTSYAKYMNFQKNSK